LKQQDGPKLLIQGSSVLIQTLLKHGLIDEITLLIFPVVFGKGKRCSARALCPPRLSSSRARSRRECVVIATYRREGRSGPAPSRMPQPSEAELARREAESREGLAEKFFRSLSIRRGPFDVMSESGFSRRR
jgi:hypothetical protein